MSAASDHARALRQQGKVAAALQRQVLREARQKANVGPDFAKGVNFALGQRFISALMGVTAKPKRSIRVAAPDGRRTFHIRVSVVNAQPDGSTGSTSAASHQAYIERESAVEQFTADAGRSAAAEAYIGREGALERATFGTIADTIADRQDYWRHVEASERGAGSDQAVADFRDAEEVAGMVAADPAVAQWIRDAAAKRRLVRRALDAAAQADIAALTAAHPDCAAARAVRISTARSGRIQFRMVAELPCDMTADQRFEIARRFTQTEFADRGAPYHCALHAPSGHNDDRNYHLHVVFHDRPAKRVANPETGEDVWDFAYIKTIRTKSGHKRETRPLRQDKIRDFADRKWYAAARARYANIVNAVRTDAGMAPIYDPRSYKDMGLDIEPVPSLTPQEYFDVMKGRPNPEAHRKMEARWERALLIDTRDAGPAPLTGPRAPDLRAAEAAVREHAPVSTPQAMAVHGSYIHALQTDHTAILNARTLDLMSERFTAAAAPPLAPKRPAPLFAAAADTATVLSREARRISIRARHEAEAIADRAVAMREAAEKSSLGSIALPLEAMIELARRMALEPAYRAAKEAARRAAEKRERERLERIAAEKRAEEERIEAERAAIRKTYPTGHPYYPDATPSVEPDLPFRNNIDAMHHLTGAWIKHMRETDPLYDPKIRDAVIEADAVYQSRRDYALQIAQTREEVAHLRRLLDVAERWRDGLANPQHPAHLDPKHPYTLNIEANILDLQQRIEALGRVTTSAASIMKTAAQKFDANPDGLFPDVTAKRSAPHHDLRAYIVQAYATIPPVRRMIVFDLEGERLNETYQRILANLPSPPNESKPVAVETEDKKRLREAEDTRERQRMHQDYLDSIAFRDRLAAQSRNKPDYDERIAQDVARQNAELAAQRAAPTVQPTTAAPVAPSSQPHAEPRPAQPVAPTPTPVPPQPVRPPVQASSAPALRPPVPPSPVPTPVSPAAAPKKDLFVLSFLDRQLEIRHAGDLAPQILIVQRTLEKGATPEVVAEQIARHHLVGKTADDTKTFAHFAPLVTWARLIDNRWMSAHPEQASLVVKPEKPLPAQKTRGRGIGD